MKDLYVLLSEKKWSEALFKALRNQYKDRSEWLLINKKEEFSLERLVGINPQKIFIPHWSYIISREIFEKYVCIVFHMTDLPFGRGGSPLQNLIVRGFSETKISAIRVCEGIDTGDIYLKETLSLEGTAREIFERAQPIICKMIKAIIDDEIIPRPQVGIPVNFKRRKQNEGDIGLLEELNQVYDFIRMLDCEGYPNAFIETKNFKFDFSNATFDREGKFINADVRIYRK